MGLRLGRIAAGAVGVLALVTLIATCNILQVRYQPADFPPGDGALSPAAAQAETARILATQTITLEDLDMKFAPSTATSVELYVDGAAFYPRILEDLSAAQSSINIDQYRFTPGEVADRFTPVLIDRVNNGVPVRLVVDRVGTGVDTTSRELYRRLTQAGVSVALNDALIPQVDGPLHQQWFNLDFDQIGHFYHRKIFVIDGRVAWVGGAGIEDYFDGSFHDMFVRIEGPAVAQLQALAMTSFAFHGGQPPANVDAYFPATPDGDIPTTVAHGVPGTNRSITDAIRNLIDHAQTRLDIIDPYVSDPDTLDRIAAAARRGAQVRFIVPLDSNAPPIQWAFNDHIEDLQAAGVQVLQYPILPHAKVIRADNRVLAGSTNLDAWALYRNWEVSLVFDSPAVADMFERQLFAPDVAVSTPAVPPSGLARLLSWLAALFTPLL